MNFPELIAHHILEIHEGGNWTEVNIKDTLADVSLKEAETLTNASPNTIASLVHHLSVWNGVVQQRLYGINPVLNNANGYDVPSLKTEAAWTQLKERNIKSAHNLADAIRNLDTQKLPEVTVQGHFTFYKTLHGIAEHAHYHLGQIVILKKLIKIKNLQPSIKNSL